MPKTTLTTSRRPAKGETNINRIAPPASGSEDWFDKGYHGLCLRISHGGTRTWCHIYRIDGKQRRRTLGTYPAMSLEAARKAWGEDRELLREGRDPEAERRKRVEEAAAERAAAITFADAVKEYHRRYLVGEAGNASADQVRKALLQECDAWKERRVASITPREIGALVEGIRDGGRPYWANRVFAYLRTFFGWCVRPSVGFVPASPCEGLKRPFEGEEARDRVLTPEEIAALWHGAGKLGVYEGAYVRVLLLTGKRKNALAAMRWEEIGADGWWRPPQPKTKRKPKKTNLPIPLPAPALKIVRSLPQLDDNPYVFAGRRRNGHLDPGSPLQRRLQAASGVEDFFWHAVRHTVATKLSELRVPGNAARRFTDHAQVKDAHEGYTHDDLADVTHDAADTWGRYVTLVKNRRVWARVSAHLAALDVPEGDRRREAQRARKREFCALIQGGGEPWARWVRSVARQDKRANVVRMRA